MTELQIHDATAGKVAYATAVAESNLLPKEYRKNPANVLYAMAYAEALAIPMINAVISVHVIEGKPSPSADLMVALARRAGHRVRVIESSAARCTIEIARGDDPESPFTVTWTIEEARSAKLTGKDVWQKYPRAMLRSRAESECVRQACSEVLAGMIYTPEELETDVDQTGAPTAVKAGPVPMRSGAAGLGALLGTSEPDTEPATLVADPRIIDPDLARQIAESTDREELAGLYRAVAEHPARDQIADHITARVAVLDAEAKA
ncbi:RecT family protein [Nakamurella panacisegetis]|uniref:RecT family protein n=1 Tax=Nakamurella panacisegetis TaxID=1090615 RepID=A0A1H0Q021_9ACTN|nr:recombinase RecT [Nakamurella panacisegetis]SDP10797.1 RecT family protein [Nakamurella panacisegetis]